MRTAELLNAMAAWLASPNNEAMLLAQEDETCMKVVAESCVLASELLRNAAEEVNLLEPTKTYAVSIENVEQKDAVAQEILFMAKDNRQAYEKAQKIVKDLGVGNEIVSIRLVDDYEASKLTPEAIEETAALATAFDASNDPELKKMASVLDELLLTISASPTALADKKTGNDARIEELKRKYNGPREVLNEMNNRAEDVKAINKSKMTDQYKIQGHLLNSRTCPQHPGAQMQRVGEGVYRCELDGANYNYALGYELNGEHVPGGSVELQTKIMYANPGETIFDTRNARLGQNE